MKPYDGLYGVYSADGVTTVLDGMKRTETKFLSIWGLHRLSTYFSAPDEFNKHMIKEHKVTVCLIIGDSVRGGR